MANVLNLSMKLVLIAVVLYVALVIVIKIIFNVVKFVIGLIVPSSTPTSQVPINSTVQTSNIAPEMFSCKEFDNGCSENTQLQTVEVRPLAYTSQRKVFKVYGLMSKHFARDAFHVKLPPVSFFGFQFEVSLSAQLLLRTTEKDRWQVSIFISPYNKSIDEIFYTACGLLSDKNYVQKSMLLFSRETLLYKHTIDVLFGGTSTTDSRLKFDDVFEFYITFSLDEIEVLPQLPDGLSAPAVSEGKMS